MIAHRPPLFKGAENAPRSVLAVGDIALRVPPILPEDTIGRAAEAVRQSPAAAVPVAEDGRIVGMVTVEELKAVLPAAGAELIRELPARTVMSTDLLCLRERVTVPHALEALRENDRDAAPVLDEMGRYVGMVGTAGLLSAACGKLRPPTIGGLATPLGVYLTSGVVRGGVGDLALASAGLFIGLLQLIASWIAFHLSPHVAVGLQALLDRLGSLTDVGAYTRLLDAHWPYAPLSLVLFGLLFRFSWVTGLHAAEHQVVHAIEGGEDLTPDAVARKPRVHPRCGTNLMAGFGTFMLLRSLGEGWDVLAFPIVLFTWRVFGGFLQEHVTTRVATPRQIDNGIAAGRQLLDRYHQNLAHEAPRWRRIWNIGLVQVALGFACLWITLAVLRPWLDPEWLAYLGM